MGCKRGRKPRKDNENYRKGPKGQTLRKGESYREGKELYYFQYLDSLSRKRVIYRKDLMALRKIEAEVNKYLSFYMPLLLTSTTQISFQEGEANGESKEYWKDN